MEIVLSVLIATMPTRKESFYNLLEQLNIQCQFGKPVEILSDSSTNHNIGVKRNSLLLRSRGKYILYVDDDDSISNDYIEKILEACKSGADCIGISGVITTNGKDQMQWHISKEFKRWFTKRGVYYRTPNHISPVKRELALQAGFPEISHGEDYEYSMRLLPLLKTETVIKGNLYHYKFLSNKDHENKQ